MEQLFNIMLLFFATLLMISALNKSNEQQSIGIWVGMFPVYLCILILTVVGVFVPSAQHLFNGVKDAFILCFLYGAGLFGLTDFLKNRKFNNVEEKNV
ncbi:hypothetical protein MHH81_20475 [Psychrobacillus sp. FSL H8-0484]|uniref:hypothetical protein n=1 Tax=Psychrobacillus sp. FSL H8-0484 TaxID=2921390 RepID=UPI0030FB3718